MGGRGCSRLSAAILLSVLLLPAFSQQAGPEELCRNGLGHFAAANYVEAIRCFRELSDRFGDEPSLAKEMESVFYALGCSYYNQEDYAGAISAFENYIKRYPAARFLDEALFRIAGAYQAEQAFGKAVSMYQRLLSEQPRSAFAEDALFQIAACLLSDGKTDKAAEAFGEFAVTFPNSDLIAQALVFRARALFELEKLEEAVRTLEALETRASKLDHVVYANFLAFEIGDVAFDNTDYDLALRGYRRVRTRESLLRMQRKVLSDYEAELRALLKQPRSPDSATTRFRAERRLKSSIAQIKEMLERLENMPDYDSGLFHRIGRCFMNSDRFWEARVAFTRVVKEAMDDKIREAAHFDLVLVLARMRLFEDVISEADRYLEIYE